MKKPIIITLAIVAFLFFTTLIISQLMGQSSEKGGVMDKPIPANVMKIAEKSCVHCHSEPGDFMAISHLNLSNWNKYSPEKQAAKASAMCMKVTEDKMPPKHFRKNHPDGVPTQEEVKTICNWAKSLEIPKK